MSSTAIHDQGIYVMSYKQVMFRSAAREKVLRGAAQLADAVRVTLGPRSKAVLIQKKWSAPIVCNDGVTIAKEFELKDPEENSMSRPVTTRKEKAQVATISAHNDPTIGELVADAMEKVGAEGVITVEESKTTETTLTVVEGMQFDRGFLSPYFVTNLEKMEAVLEDPLVLLSDRKIGVLKDLIPLLDQVAKSG